MRKLMMLLLALCLPAAGPAQGAGITGTVKLAPALADQAAPTDQVFVFAQATQGPRMPLAIVRATAGDLPLSFTLDDSTAMMPRMQISHFDEVRVVARVSKSGGAMPRSGDLEGTMGPMANDAEGVEVVIDRVLP
jgi:cytochrome c-type biogenesis protein CcmH